MNSIDAFIFKCDDAIVDGEVAVVDDSIKTARLRVYMFTQNDYYRYRRRYVLR